MDNLVFIGGIHGSGKGTICNEICKRTEMIHLTASEVLNWQEIGGKADKIVKDIQFAQDRLITRLFSIVEKGKSYLLDGHFCLFNSEGEVEKVPEDTFVKIAPRLIAVAVTEPDKIQKRLEKRDKIVHKFDVLSKMQIIETKYAEEIALYLQVPFIKIMNGDYQQLMNAL